MSISGALSGWRELAAPLLFAAAFAAMLLFTAIEAFGAPFLVSDPDPNGFDKCVYQVGTATPIETPTVVTPPALTGACRIDLASMPTGTSNLLVWFRSTVWGVETAKAPFVLRRPTAGGTAPASLRLEP